MDSWQWLSTSSWFSVTDSCILSQCRADSLWICVMFGHGKSVLRKLGQPDKRCICCKSRMSCGIRSYNKCSKCCHRPWHSPTIVLPLIYYPVMICCLKSGQTSAVSDVSEVYGEKCFAEHCITLSFAKTTVLNLCSRPKNQMKIKWCSRSSLRDASRGDYVVPRTNRKTADRAFSTAAPRAWNQLPTELKRTQSSSAFRRGLKMFLLSRAYCSE